MRVNSINSARILRHDEKGQVAIIMVMILPVVFLFFAMAADAGIWFFDHRLAQNQADAAVLAAVQYLPADLNSENHHLALAAVNEWVTKNGSNPDELSCGDGRPSPEFLDLHPTAIPDGRIDAVRVCVRRESPGIFSKLADLDFIYVSAAATARVGPASVANVMPWGLVPADPDCNSAGERCQADMDGDGVVDDDEDCGFFPDPLNPGLSPLCPWGMSEDKLWIFKSAESITPGNFSPISACGLGAVEYVDCIEGEVASEFFEAGETVFIAVQNGSLGANTDAALDKRYANEAITGPRSLECDVESTPAPVTGWDARGKDRALATYAPGNRFTETHTLAIDGHDHIHEYDYVDGCEFRLVTVPILSSLPEQGHADVVVLGIATFAIAKWDRYPQYGNALGTPSEACGEATNSGPVDETVFYKCQMVWGYFMRDVRPPQMLLNISETDNPFAPLMIAIVE